MIVRKENSAKTKDVVGKIQIINNLLTFFCVVSFEKSKMCSIFGDNNTCHASHKNSAPGRVFAFYSLCVSLSSKSHAYGLQ